MTNTTAPDLASDELENIEDIEHPGMLWLNEAACGELADDNPEALSLFFVEAGHVISEETLNVCRGCPVRRECIIHFYLGGPNNTPISNGYGGGFSYGQRKAMSLPEALRRARHDPPRPLKKRAGK